MSIKDLFNQRSHQIIASSSLDTLGNEVESAAYITEYLEDQFRLEPHVDFSDPANFAKYGSAKEYYDTAIRWIWGNYPYDGSLKEKIEWRNSSTLLDLYIYDVRYPKTTGYAVFSPTRWGTHTGSLYGGYGAPASSDYEFIGLKGGPGTPYGQSYGTASLETLFNSRANVWDNDVTGSGTRESNLKTELSGGVTVEFWLQTGSLPTSKTEKQVVFDMWNNQPSSSATYGRLRIEIDGTDGGTPFRVALMSGAAGAGLGTSSLAVGANIDLNTFSSWKHYAFSFANSGNELQIKFYVDGALSETINTGSSIGEIRESLEANIGSLITGTYGTTWTAPGVGSPALGWGKLSGSIDEFRFWKTKRSSKDIGRYWFTSKVGGGTNTDFANTTLGVYYKFNEGISEHLPTDKTVLDYSGRITNGTWTGYETSSTGPVYSSSRNTGSAIVSASAGIEDLDPIVRSNHPLIIALSDELLASGTVYDYENNSSMFYSMPSWIIEEDEGPQGTTGDLKKLTQIIGSQFDDLQLQIGELAKLNIPSYPSSSADLKDFKPYPYMYRAVESHGLEGPELFSDSTILEYLANRNETKEYGEDLQRVKNLIYGNVYKNLIGIYKAKGTEKSFRNLVRCFGVGDDLIRINAYSNNGKYKFDTKRRNTSHKTNAINFNSVDRFQSTIYQYPDTSNENSVGYISGSATDDLTLEDSFPITVEAEIMMPKKISSQYDVGQAQSYPHLTASLFGLHTPKMLAGTDVVARTNTDTTWDVADPANFQVFAIRDDAFSKNVKFSISSSALLPNHPGISSSYYEDVYDNQKWNFAVRLKPHGYPHSFTTGALSNNYTLEFYGVNYFSDRKIHEFTVTGSVSKQIAESFLVNPKRIYAGAHYSNFTGSVLQRSDVKVLSLRYWLNYLNDAAIQNHALDPENFGSPNPDRSSFLLESDLPNTYVPQIESLALHWNFDTVTGSSAGSGPTSFDGKFDIEDASSGSLSKTQRFNWIGKIVNYQHTGRGDFFPTSNTASVDQLYLHAAKQQLPEIIFGDDNVRVLSTAEKEVFTRETRPYKTYYAFEKSMYQIISDEIINYFGSIVEFNNIVGNPVNRYRPEYKDIKHLRQFFFERVANEPDLDRFVEYYKWLDASLEAMLMQLVPASAQTSDGIDNIVESHVLERNKYWNKFPVITNYPATSGSAKGINRLLYNWRYGHRPLSGEQSDNCFYWKQRAERDTSPLSSSTHGPSPQPVNADRNMILTSSVQILERQYGTPYRYVVERTRNLHGGINYSDNKKYYYFRGVNMPHGERTSIGLPMNVINAWNLDVKDLKDCDDHYIQNPNKKVKYSFGTNTGREESSGSHDTVKGEIAMPFNIYSASQGLGGYNETVQEKFLSNSQLVNLHNDGYGTLNEVPMQGPFTEKYVGGHQARHVRINYYDSDRIGGDGATTENNLDGLYSRPESWRLLFAGGPANSGALGLTGPDYGGPYPDPTKYRAWYFREETTKRPINIRNILQTTASVDTPLSGVMQHGAIGNYEKSYQIVQTSGRSTNNPWFNDGQTELLPARYANDLPKTTNVHTLVAVRPQGDGYTRGNTFIPGTTPAGANESIKALRRLSSRYYPSKIVAAHEGRQTVFSLPDRTKQDTVFVERFSAPGGPEINSLGFLDVMAAEKSVYNALPYRNLSVRSSGSGEASGSGGTSMMIEDHTNRQRGLRTLLSLHCGPFGSDGTYGEIKSHRGADDLLSASFHKTNRNALHRLRGNPNEAVSGSIYDNWYVQHPIPQNDIQYSWISASVSGTEGYRNASGHAPRSGLVSGSDGFHGAIHFLSASEALAVLDGANRTFGTIGRKNAATAKVHIPVDFVGLNTIVYDATGSAFNILGPLVDAHEVSGTENYLNRSMCAAGYSENGDVDMFNAIMLNRNGPYGYSSWRQINNHYHPLVRQMRKSNTVSIIDPDTLISKQSGLHFYDWKPMKSSNDSSSYSSLGGPIWTLEDIFGTNNEYISNQSREVLSYTEPAVVSRYNPLHFRVVVPTEGLKTKNNKKLAGKFIGSSINTTYANSKAHFTNSKLNSKLQLDENKTTPADKLLDAMNRGKVKGQLDYVTYGETVFPKEQNLYQKQTRGRPTFGVSYWRDNRVDREIKDTTNSMGNALKTGSMWPLDGRKNFNTTDPHSVVPYGNIGYFPSTGSEGELMNINTQIFNGNEDCITNRILGGDGAAAAFITASILYARRHTLLTGSSATSPSCGVTGSAANDCVFGSGDAPWDAGLQAGKYPFYYDSYAEYSEHMQKIGKDYSVLPEYRMSERIDDYLMNGVNPLQDSALFSLTGGLANTTSSTQNNFYKTYSNSDFMKYFNVVQTDLADEVGAKARSISVTCNAMLKLLPYDGFYPVLRSVQIASLFSQSYGKNFILTGSDRRAPRSALVRPLMAPMFAPGVFFNTIKSGIAVDYPVYTASNVVAERVALDVRRWYGLSGSFVSGPGSVWPWNSTYENFGLAGTQPETGKIFSQRIPFEALVEPESHLANVKMIDMEPHPSCSINATASWGGHGDKRYKLAMNNFLGEVPEFFLENQSFTSFVSSPESTWTQTFDMNKSYQMLVKVRKSFVYNDDAFGGKDSAADTTVQQFGLDPQTPNIVSGTETICMYSRPTAFGPPSTYNDVGGFVATYGGDSQFVNQQNYWRMGASLVGYNPPFTPCYYDGEAWATIEWNPKLNDQKEMPKLDILLSQVTTSYLRYDDSPGGFGHGATGGPQERGVVNTNANQVSSSINLFGSTKGLSDILKFTGVNLEQSENRWVIQSKFETPILNFIDAKNGPLTPIHDKHPCVGGNHTRPIGMWHQYGRIPSGSEGIYLEIADVPISGAHMDQGGLGRGGVQASTGSLADLVGFAKDSVRLGKTARTKTISEAVVAIPFIETTKHPGGKIRYENEKKLFPIPKQDVQMALDINKPAPQSVQEMVNTMQKYVFPPSMDFINYPDDISPFAMYIFEFEHQLDQQDLTDIWQNLPPKIAASFDPNSPDKLSTPQVMQAKTVSHRFNIGEMVPSMQNRMKWMVFKVKRRAESNYFNKSVQNNNKLITPKAIPKDVQSLMNIEPLDFVSAGAAKGAVTKEGIEKLTYNWPYDFFSLVELVKIDSDVTFEVQSDAISKKTD